MTFYIQKQKSFFVMDKCSVTSVALIQDLKQDALKFLIYKKSRYIDRLISIFACLYLFYRLFDFIEFRRIGQGNNDGVCVTCRFDLIGIKGHQFIAFLELITRIK